MAIAYKYHLLPFQFAYIIDYNDNCGNPCTYHIRTGFHYYLQIAEPKLYGHQPATCTGAVNKSTIYQEGYCNQEPRSWDDRKQHLSGGYTRSKTSIRQADDTDETAIYVNEVP